MERPITMQLTTNEANILFAALTEYKGTVNECPDIHLRAKLVAEIREDLRQRLIWCLHTDEIDEMMCKREGERHDDAY